MLFFLFHISKAKDLPVWLWEELNTAYTRRLAHLFKLAFISNLTKFTIQMIQNPGHCLDNFMKNVHETYSQGMETLSK